MQELKKIWAFGLPYLRPYMARFVAGVALGVLFGMSNGMFVLSVDTLFSRLSPPTPSVCTARRGEFIFSVSPPTGSGTVRPWT